METSRATLIFFEPNTPPLPLPVLTAHTELPPVSLSPPNILAHEEFRDKPPRPTLRRTVQAQRHQTPEIRFDKIRLKGRARDDAVSEASESSVEYEDLSDAESASPTNDLIPKPDGEPGHPRCGGYNIEDALHWDAKVFKKLKVCIQQILYHHWITDICP